MKVIICIILAGICKAVCDKIQFHFSRCTFKDFSDFWNPKESHKFKWKNGDKKQGERFLLSSTWLVGVTDAWHLFQSLQWTFLILAVIVYEPITNWILLDFLILRIAVYPPSFHIPFTYLLNNKK